MSKSNDKNKKNHAPVMEHHSPFEGGAGHEGAGDGSSGGSGGSGLSCRCDSGLLVGCGYGLLVRFGSGLLVRLFLVSLVRCCSGGSGSVRAAALDFLLRFLPSVAALVVLYSALCAVLCN